MLNASIIVCTHNRADLLAEAMEGVSRMIVPDSATELIVVDNASSDDTHAVYDAHEKSIPIPSRYIYEETLGLSAARNRAVAEAKGDVLAFLDDDAIPEPDWLVGLLACYRDHPDAECVGGKVVLRWVGTPPPWWGPSMDHHLSAVDYGEQPLKLTYPRYPYGANISFKKTVFDRGECFDPSLGRRGKALGGGEEMALCLAIEGVGGGIYYTPASSVRHLAEAARANTAYLYKKSVLHGRSAARLERVHRGFDFRVKKLTAYFIQGIVRWLKAGRSVKLGCEWRYRAGYVTESLRQMFCL